MNSHPTVFISYSWDNRKNQEWVLNFAADLLKNGVLTTVDILETQKGSVHLETMMVSNIQKNDFTIIIMTPDYAKKADLMAGGVGVETRLLMNVIRNNPDKIIPVLLEKKGGISSIPFYLENFHYQDFTDGIKYEEALSNLLHRIYGVEIYSMPSIGNPPLFLSKQIMGNVSQEHPNHENQVDTDNHFIPNLRSITDRDKVVFMRDSFQRIISKLDNLLEKTKINNSNFECDKDNITATKNIYRFYINGTNKFSLKIWLGNGLGTSTPSINLSYGRMISEGDNSFNEIINCVVGSDNTLNLKMTMNFSLMNKLMTAEEIISEIWNIVVNGIG